MAALELSRVRLGFGSFIAVEAAAGSATVAEQGIEAAFESLARVERLMHPTSPGSDLAALNACSPGRYLTVHPWTWQVLRLSQRLHRLSDGAFDPCPPGTEGRMDALLLVAPSRVAKRLALQIDLGGIAKGYAVDRAIAALRRAGCHRGLVNAGGDLRVFGPEVRQIVCRDAAGRSCTVLLRNRALASTDVLSRSRPPEHRGYYDAAGRTISSGTATVLARRAVFADALTKCLLSGDADDLLARLGAARVQIGRED